MTDERRGVSVAFFGAAIKALVRQHGDRDASPRMEEFRQALETAETIFLAMPAVVKKPRQPRASTKGA